MVLNITIIQFSATAILKNRRDFLLFYNHKLILNRLFNFSNSTKNQQNLNYSTFVGADKN